MELHFTGLVLTVLKLIQLLFELKCQPVIMTILVLRMRSNASRMRNVSTRARGLIDKVERGR